MNLDVIEAFAQLEKEKGIKKDILISALEAALVSAFKRNFGSAHNVRVEVDPDSGTVQVFARKNVVDDVKDPRSEISLAEALTVNPNYATGDVIETEVTPRDFGRIAAQTAKQVVLQKIREAEREVIFEEYSNREGDVVTGVVQRYEGRNVIVDLGRVEAVMPLSEQMQKESYQQGERLKVYIVEVRNTPRGPQVVVSRTHPGLLKRLLELEVPEIYDGIVVIRQIAREAGIRSKVAVSATDPNVDPVGACVGPRGIRVQKIVTELKGEKIDVIEWRESPEEYIANALSPAKVLGVRINAVVKAAMVIVPDNQLSLAIGRAGQNARLAAKLTGWKIDIKSESQALELPKVEELEATKSTEPVVEEREDVATPEEMAGEHGEQNAPDEQSALEEESAGKQEEQNASEEEQSAPEKVVGEEGAKEGTTPYSEDEGKSKVKKKQKKKGIADDAKILEEEDEAEASRKKVKRRPKMKRKHEELLEDEEEDDYF